VDTEEFRRPMETMTEGQRDLGSTNAGIEEKKKKWPVDEYMDKNKNKKIGKKDDAGPKDKAFFDKDMDISKNKKFDKKDDAGPKFGKKDDAGPKFGKKEDAGPKFGKKDDAGPKFGKKDDAGPKEKAVKSDVPMKGPKDMPEKAGKFGKGMKGTKENPVKTAKFKVSKVGEFVEEWGGPKNGKPWARD